MLETGGFPVVVTEERLRQAHRAAHEHTDIDVDPTGTAGLAGALELAERGVLGRDEVVVVLFTGAERKATRYSD
jgi:threonine synthase